MSHSAAVSHTGYIINGSPKTGLFMGTWGFFFGFASVALYGPAAHYFQQQMGLGGIALGFLVAAPQLTGSLARIPFGTWVDKVGGRLPMLTLFAFALIGMWGLVFILVVTKDITSSMYPLILFFGFMCGFGVASFSVGIPQVAYWHPQNRQGTALGIYGGVGNLAPGIFTLALPFAIAAFGLTGAYLIWFLIFLVGTVVYALFAVDAPYFQLRKEKIAPEESVAIARENGEELFPKASAWQGLFAASEDTRTWGLTMLYFTSFGGFLALTAWFPSYWINLHHVSPTMAGLIGGLGFALLAALIRVVGGILSERFGGEIVSFLAFIAVLAAALTLTFSMNFAIDLGAEILIALGMGIANAAVFKMLPKYVPEAVGGASGIVGGLGATGGFILPPFLGAVVDAMGPQGYAGGFFAYVILAIISIIVSWIFLRYRGEIDIQVPAADPAK